MLGPGAGQVTLLLPSLLGGTDMAIGPLILQQGTVQGLRPGLESNREARAWRLRITALKMSASGCRLRAETRLWVTVASGMLGGPPASRPGSGSRAPPGGSCKNFFPV